MPSAGGVFLGVVKRRNSMITDTAPPASYASTKANLAPKLLVNGTPADYAIALGCGTPQCGSFSQRTLSIDVDGCAIGGKSA